MKTIKLSITRTTKKKKKKKIERERAIELSDVFAGTLEEIARFQDILFMIFKIFSYSVPNFTQFQDFFVQILY